MKHIKLLDSTQDYTTNNASYDKPNVCLCKDAPTTVYYNPSSNS